MYTSWAMLLRCYLKWRSKRKSTRSQLILFKSYTLINTHLVYVQHYHYRGIWYDAMLAIKALNFSTLLNHGHPGSRLWDPSVMQHNTSRFSSKVYNKIAPLSWQRDIDDSAHFSNYRLEMRNRTGTVYVRVLNPVLCHGISQSIELICTPCG